MYRNMGYKLYYFPVKGRAEAARIIFAQAGVDFEDYRTKEGEWPGTLKARKSYATHNLNNIW